MLPSQRLSLVTRRAILFLIAAGIASVISHAAQAQITTNTLIGDSVSNPGTEYSDIDEAIKRFANRDPLGGATVP